MIVTWTVKFLFIVDVSCWNHVLNCVLKMTVHIFYLGVVNGKGNFQFDNKKWEEISAIECF